MRKVSFLISSLVTIALVCVLNKQLTLGGSKTPRLGYFLSPQKGFWQNAEPVDVSFNENLSLSGVRQGVDVYIDDRLVPHVFAQTDEDAAYVQGYLHAKFRLWQMEFQVRIAAGRLSEILGKERLPIDKYFRRMGMVYAAEQSLKAMEAHPETKAICDAYTAGVNSYIGQLNANNLPFEYKLLDYKPEPWNNLKSALFLKFMSYDLAYGGNDFTYTNAKNYFGYDDYMKLFPNWQDTFDPIVPKGTVFPKPAIVPKAPANEDSVYLKNKSDYITASIPTAPDKDNGSNNWAVAGSKTKSGKPILCNDPHLGLNLPSLWYEMQITTSTHSTYGVSFPGSPAIIIGFNDSIAWGVTNAGRDVKDFYEMKFKDSSMKQYWYNGAWHDATIRKEVIKIKGEPDDVENIAMTVYGPVMYDKNYKAADSTDNAYALRWAAHDSSNELLTFFHLDKAKNYDDYVSAITTFKCPGQNFVFASKSGDIAIRQQGRFIAKWNQQGDFVMPGTDSTYNWQGYIPIDENPQMKNPVRGFVSSANQKAVDSTYPYYLGSAANFDAYRGYIINRYLSSMNNITPEDMQRMQTDNYNLFAEVYRPTLLKYLNESALNENEKKYFTIYKNWNLRNDPLEDGATIFSLWKDSLEQVVFADEFSGAKLPMAFPTESSLIENIIRDSTYKFLDNVLTKDKKETISDDVLLAFKKIIPKLDSLNSIGKLNWGAFKDTHVSHLTRLNALSRLHLPIGGGTHIINATKSDHGPSWRMIVHLTDKTEAYGVYPGGQSGNPGSKYYDTFVDAWSVGQYYKLLVLTKEEAAHDAHIKWKMQIKPA